METSINSQRQHARRWRTVLLALLAVGFLLAMILTGKLPETLNRCLKHIERPLSWC